MPFIVGVSGISGSGKTTLVKKLGQTLNATTVFWDDYDDISKGPEDYVEWFTKSKNYDDWRYDALSETLKSLKDGKRVLCPATKRLLEPTPMVVFDAPLGYKHSQTGQYIDFLVFLDTELDVAMGRRLLRDYRTQKEKKDLLEEVEHYLEKARPVFLLSYEKKEMNDLILDGQLSLEKQVETIINKIRSRSAS